MANMVQGTPVQGVSLFSGKQRFTDSLIGRTGENNWYNRHVRKWIPEKQGGVTWQTW
jgi:hypothetical protein